MTKPKFGSHASGAHDIKVDSEWIDANYRSGYRHVRVIGVHTDTNDKHVTVVNVSTGRKNRVGISAFFDPNPSRGYKRAE